MSRVPAELAIDIIENPEANPPVVNFYVEPPISEAEKQTILVSQGPRSILAELITYPDAEDSKAIFTTSDYDKEFNLVMGETLANAVMSVRGITQATLTQNGASHEIET